MSFILDALKKSEAERLRRDTPGFSTVPDSGRDKPASRWLWVIAVLVVVNLGVLTLLYLRPERAADVAADTPVTAAATGPAANARMAEQEPEPQPVQAEAVTMKSAAPAAVEVAPPRYDPALLPAQEVTPTITESYATFDELRARGTLQLPDLHLDIHVYGAKPADRFVFVNMSKYKEKATLEEGPVVREITPEGVILDYRGTPFLLPRE